jgi:uncharacterized protein YjiS (DUF1127 family)
MFMQCENQLPIDRSCRSVMLRGETAKSDAGNMLAGQSAALGPRSCRQTHLLLLEYPDRGNDEALQTSSDTAWRAASAGRFGLMAKAAGGFAARGVLAFPCVLLAVVSWIAAQAVEGCATYAAAMYPMPMDVDDRLDRHDPAAGTERGDFNRVGRPRSGSSEMSPTTKGETKGDGPVLRRIPSCGAALEVEHTVRPRTPRFASLGLIALMRSAETGFWSRMRSRRDSRLGIAELRSLDDRSLRDIGISRCDIEYFVRHGDRRE